MNEKKWEKLRHDLRDQSVYRNEEEKRKMWLSSWKNARAAQKFVDAAESVDGQEVEYFNVERDYTRFKRRDAPKNGLSETD